MSGPLLAFNASLRRAAIRPRSVVRAIVAMLVFFLVATPVSAALCAASMGVPPGPAMHASSHDGYGPAAIDRDSSGNDCCDSQVTVDLTAVPRSPDSDSLAVSLHLLALAGPVAVAHDATSWSRESIRAGVEAGPPPPESVFRRLPRLLI